MIVRNSLFIKHKVKKANRSKFLFTPGPASLTCGNLEFLGPAFGRNDPQYLDIEYLVLEWLREISGQPKVARLQGSATLAIEVGLENFVTGKVLLIQSGYYSERIANMLSRRQDINLKIFDKSIEQGDKSKFDWVIACPTETSTAFFTPISGIRKLADGFGAKLFLDATGSIGLENNHELGDVVCFSSCKGLFGLTGASFVAFGVDPIRSPKEFSLSLSTYVEKKTTGPYHAIQSLFANIEKFLEIKHSVEINKTKMLQLHDDLLVHPIKNQPLLCTAVNATIESHDSRVVLYQPRSINNYSVVCHLGEAHLGLRARGDILSKISLTPTRILK
jgi:aspartate aminotransferase-like enzyme